MQCRSSFTAWAVQRYCSEFAVGHQLFPERHCIFDCPRFCELRQEHADLFGDAHAMRFLMWHKDQKSVCAPILAIVSEAQT